MITFSSFRISVLALSFSLFCQEQPSVPSSIITCNAATPDVSFSGEEQQIYEEPLDEVPFVPNIRRKLLMQAYESLSDAIEADDIVTVRSLFIAFPGLKAFSLQPLGTPLHFVKSKKMAQFLVEELGFSPNVCDQWGEFPSRALQLSKDDRFTSKKEQRALVRYLKSRESHMPKLWSQLMFNKSLHMKLSIGAMSTVLITQLAALIKFLAAK